MADPRGVRYQGIATTVLEELRKAKKTYGAEAAWIDYRALSDRIPEVSMSTIQSAVQRLVRETRVDRYTGDGQRALFRIHSTEIDAI